MKKKFLILLTCLFSLSAASLIVIQFIQTKRAIDTNSNMFNISVNNAMEEMIDQLNRLKVEDYLSRNDRYRLLKYRRVEELNAQMKNIVKENYSVFYDTNKVLPSVTMVDSVKTLPGVHLSKTDSAAIARYNTTLYNRDRLTDGAGFYDQFVSDISEYVIDNILSSNTFNHKLLDSLINEKLIANGIDTKPNIGIYDNDNNTYIYCNNDNIEKKLNESPFKYRFHPYGTLSPNEFFIVLHFPNSFFMLTDISVFYFIFSFVLISLILLLFFLSLRTIIQQEKLDEMKNDFINNMTHEIKTPLATIGLACEMLQDKTISANAESNATYIGIINDENRRMRMLVDTLLQSARMAKKNFSITRQESDMHELILSVIKSVRISVDNRGGTLITSFNSTKPNLMVDPMHITNVIYNLIDNAIKYTREKPQIVVSTSNSESHFSLSVKDNGIGISKEDQRHIFERFYRVSTGDIHDVKGFGIGLNYVYEIVRMHNGKIDIESSVGAGSTFTITIPYTVA